MKPLVIGVGNPDRGDDGAGPAVVALLELEGVEVRRARGEATELLQLFAGRELVYVVDAVVSGQPPGSLHRLDGHELPPFMRCTSTHGLGLAEAVELARVLGSLPPRLVVLGIEAAQLRVGDEMSAPVRRAVECLARGLQEELSRTAPGEPPDLPVRTS